MSLVFRRKVLTIEINLGSMWTISESKTMDGERGTHTKAREGTGSSCEMPGQTEQRAKAETGRGLRGRRNMSLRWAHETKQKMLPAGRTAQHSWGLSWGLKTRLEQPDCKWLEIK